MTRSLKRGNDTVISRDFIIEVLKGNVPGHSQKHIHGLNSSVGTSYVDIWESASKMAYLSSAETLSVVSTSTSDTSAGTGARTIYVTGLDSTYSPISETITLNGTTPVTTTLSYLRVGDCEASTTGSGLENVGTISFTSSSTSRLQCVITPTDNHALNGHYTVPKGKYAIFLNYEINTGKGKDVMLVIKIGTGHSVLKTIHLNNIYESTLFSPVADTILTPQTDVCFRAKSDVASSAVSVACNVLEIEEKYIT